MIYIVSKRRWISADNPLIRRYNRLCVRRHKAMAGHRQAERDLGRRGRRDLEYWLLTRKKGLGAIDRVKLATCLEHCLPWHMLPPAVRIAAVRAGYRPETYGRSRCLGSALA